MLPLIASKNDDKIANSDTDAQPDDDSNNSGRESTISTIPACCACCGCCGCAPMSTWVVCMTALNVIITSQWSVLLAGTFSHSTGIICYVIIHAILRLLMNILGYFIIIIKKYKISDPSWLATFGNMTISFSFTFDTIFLFYSNWLASFLTHIESIFSNIFFVCCNVFPIIDLLIVIYSTVVFNRYCTLNYDFSGMRLCNLCKNNLCGLCSQSHSQQEKKSSGGNCNCNCNCKEELETRPQRISLLIGILSLGLFIWGIIQTVYELTNISIIKSHYNKWSVEYYTNYNSIDKPRQMQHVYINGTTYNNAYESIDEICIVYVASNKGVYGLIDINCDQINDEMYLILPSITGRSCTSVVVDQINDALFVTEWQNIYRCALNYNYNYNYSRMNMYNTSQYKNIHEYVLHSDNHDITHLCSLWFTQTYYSHHGRHYTQLNPNTNNLCISMGVACNICNATDVDKSPQGNLQSKIICFNDMNNPSWENSTDYVIGTRDVVGFTWDDNDTLWFTDHNVDRMGDNRPDCEFNKLSYIGEHFGFPMCHSIGKGDPYLRDAGQTDFIVDDVFGRLIGYNCTHPNPNININTTFSFTPAIQPLGPHVAPDGVMYYRKLSNDEEGKVFLIGEHGSWNRKNYIGYRVVMVVMDRNNDTVVVKHEVFVDGWLNDDKQLYSGRPVDMVELKDGSVLISDDVSGSIFRVFDDNGNGKTVEQEMVYKWTLKF